MKRHKLKTWIAFTLAVLVPAYGAVVKYSTYNPRKIYPIRIPSTNGFDKLITDNMLVNTYYNEAQTMRFLESFPGNIMTRSERLAIYRTAKKYHLNIIAFVTKIELESSLITWGCGDTKLYRYRMQWAMGAGMYITINSNGRIIKPYAGWDKQIDHGAYTLRRHFNAWTNGAGLWINERRIYVKPRNAATYALYKYTPYWGTWCENGAVCSGQEYFSVVYNRMAKKWKEVNK